MYETKNILLVKLFSTFLICVGALFSVSCNNGSGSITAPTMAVPDSPRVMTYPLSWKLLYKDTASVNTLAVFSPNILFIGDSMGVVGRIKNECYKEIWGATDKDDIILSVAIDDYANVYFTRDAQWGGGYLFFCGFKHEFCLACDKSR